MFVKLLWLGVAGAAGTVARYSLAGFVQQAGNGSFPWGTLAVNVVGCLVAGLFWAIAEDRTAISGETRVIVLVGFMGAFTTFSAFMAETGELLQDAEWTWALGNLTLQNVLGVGMFLVGLSVGRLL